MSSTMVSLPANPMAHAAMRERKSQFPPLTFAPLAFTPFAFTPLAFAAGTVAGAVALLVGYPLDTLKVRAQVGHFRSSPDAGTPQSRLQHLRLLYRGAAAPVISAGAIQCVNLGTYENVCRYLSQTNSSESATLAQVTLAGSIGGLVVSPITCPQHRIKIHQQTSGGSLVAKIREFYRMNGIRAFYRGYPLHAMFESLRGMYMLTYVATKRTLHTGSEATMPMYKRMLSGAAAGTFGWSIVYPMDVVKSVLQAERAGHSRFASAWDCAGCLYREGGIPRFYRGFTFTLFRAGPVAASLLPTYDVALRCLAPYF
ncbi:Carrier protein YMC1 [Diplonema papillatum]|nr:Carrier protein YMC1 [Diplonema papillatum]KAJ9441807.1 Carrier protein YMC1 [Diplonema papillatum]